MTEDQYHKHLVAVTKSHLELITRGAHYLNDPVAIKAVFIEKLPQDLVRVDDALNVTVLKEFVDLAEAKRLWGASCQLSEYLDDLKARVYEPKRKAAIAALGNNYRRMTITISVLGFICLTAAGYAIAFRLGFI